MNRPKLIYTNREVELELEELVRKGSLNVDIEFQIDPQKLCSPCIPTTPITPKEVLEIAVQMKTAINPLIDVWKYLFFFINENPIAGGLVGSAIWEGVKETVKLAKKFKSNKHIALITDNGMAIPIEQEDVNRIALIFLFPTDITEQLLKEYSEKIDDFREKIIKFLNNIVIDCKQIEIEYLGNDKWKIGLNSFQHEDSYPESEVGNTISGMPMPSINNKNSLDQIMGLTHQIGDLFTQLADQETDDMIKEKYKKVGLILSSI